MDTKFKVGDTFLRGFAYPTQWEVINTKLTKVEKQISNLIAKDLKKENIFFAGIDLIDQKLNGDINVTSPTGIKTYYDLSGKNLAKTFWKELKA